MMACSIPTIHIYGEGSGMTACLFHRAIWYCFFDDQEPQKCGSYTTQDSRYLRGRANPILAIRAQPVAALTRTVFLSALSCWAPTAWMSRCPIDWKKIHDGGADSWFSPTCGRNKTEGQEDNLMVAYVKWTWAVSLVSPHGPRNLSGGWY